MIMDIAFNNINERINNLSILQEFMKIAGQEESVEDKLAKINGYIGYGEEPLIKDKIVLLPTEGIPTKPTSANTLSSHLTILSSPGSPNSLILGAGSS